ncbi:hypothetical protein [Pseudomonas psychrophila]|uniref:hypothetical protein n=1 Tax=Pseudomonas psychrophila TaxID=122355 RepID=UPI00035768F4|nr:hypothetical protein [Pseudomonas psychrophila]EPJ93240.1 hypothetical protein CF149_13135 [Pseudomonas psychrophila]QIE34102.1 hypothetical protein G5J76_18335 [Pseudomonas psychrophila]WVI96198.1 hypothetical protein VR624_15480 [Pseudomonas psychrophila]
MFNLLLASQAALTNQYIKKAQGISNIDIPDGIFILNGQGGFKSEVSAHDGN